MVYHINIGDFPEEVAYASKLALEYRQKFRKDVIIDVICYRRMGHNELDEPGFTQPAMYKKIRALKSVAEKYEHELSEQGVSNETEYEATKEEYFKVLDGQLQKSYDFKPEVQKINIEGCFSKEMEGYGVYAI
jgi:probable 2-oxoglutarate dehydrogenase E1 component DHKTD1